MFKRILLATVLLAVMSPIPYILSAQPHQTKNGDCGCKRKKKKGSTYVMLKRSPKQ